MKVPFDALTVCLKTPYEIVKTSEMQPLLEDHGKVKYFLMMKTEGLLFIIWNWNQEAIGNQNLIFVER